MKSKSEYRNAFSSCTFFYRILDMLSTQRFRLPVRRYILDLFDIQLDADVVQELAACAQRLQAPGNTQSPKVTKLKPRVVSTFGRPGRVWGNWIFMLVEKRRRHYVVVGI